MYGGDDSGGAREPAQPRPGTEQHQDGEQDIATSLVPASASGTMRTVSRVSVP